jgi:hypothetical protein
LHHCVFEIPGILVDVELLNGAAAGIGNKRTDISSPSKAVITRHFEDRRSAPTFPRKEFDRRVSDKGRGIMVRVTAFIGMGDNQLRLPSREQFREAARHRR